MGMFAIADDIKAKLLILPVCVPLMVTNCGLGQSVGKQSVVQSGFSAILVPVLAWTKAVFQFFTLFSSEPQRKNLIRATKTAARPDVRTLTG